MTTTVKQHTENGYYIYLEITKTNVWRVGVCPCYEAGRCGYPIREMTYSYNDKKNAMATYRRYIKTYCKGE